MRGSIVVGALAVLALGLIAAPLGAQTTVQGRVVFRSGTVRGPAVVRQRAHVGDSDRYVVVVNRVRVPRGWWKKHDYQKVTVYYDGDRYYLRRLARPNLHPVIVYERGGRYFVGEKHWKRKHRSQNRHDDRYRDSD
jgi:hypothetical protein